MIWIINSKMLKSKKNKELSERSGVYYRQIQNVGLGSSDAGDAGNMTAKNLIALADAIGVDVKELM